MPSLLFRSLPRFALGALLPLLALSGFSAAEDSVPSLLPRPQEVRVDVGRFVLRNGLVIQIATDAPARVREIAELLGARLREETGIATRIDSSRTAPTAGVVRLALETSPQGPAVSPEGYRVRIGSNVEVSAGDTRGLLWGVQTLVQAIQHGTEPFLLGGAIADAPAHAWRALMLDPVRSFLDLDFLRRTIRVMSAYKLNLLHLHLSDDHAWRFESKIFPRLNPPGEPCYSQADLRELVAFARRHGVEIIPEFDFPGHAQAAVKAYPELDCEGRTRPMDEAIFCSGKPFTWEFMDKLVAEAAEIFPSPYFHLGADEPFAVKRWESCPHCRARMRAKGVSTLPALYHTVVNDLDALARRHGKRAIVWNDAIHPGIAPLPPKDLLIDAWTGQPDVQALAEAGYTLINSSNRPLYLSSYGQRQGFPLTAVWQWTPRVFGLREARSSDADLKSAPLPESAQVVGGQACIWATDQRIAEQRLYPRLLAVAETLWAGEHRGSFPDFTARWQAGQQDRLRRLGVPDDEALPSETLFGASAADSGATIRMVDGVLRAPASASPAFLTTTRATRDFILTFERRAEINSGNTGFLVRCAPTIANERPAGFPVPSAPPEGMKVSADVAALKGWNRFELVARGAVVSLTINGYLAWSATDPAPRSGPIVLATEAAEFEMRNIRLRPLDASP